MLCIEDGERLGNVPRNNPGSDRTGAVRLSGLAKRTQQQAEAGDAFIVAGEVTATRISKGLKLRCCCPMRAASRYTPTVALVEHCRE